MGFHNRLKITSMNPGITVQLDFWNLESWRYTLNRGGSSFISRLLKKM
ncbi:MAG: hypothetical protein WAT71_11390 [Ignavibacteria bacterium]